MFQTELDKFREILARLPDAVKGEPKHWIARVVLHAGSKILFSGGVLIRRSIGDPRNTFLPSELILPKKHKLNDDKITLNRPESA